MSVTLLSLALFCAAAPPVKTSKTPETMLYVRTTPSGAEILLDEKPLGTSPGLFKVPPGVRRVVVELDGYQPGDEEVTIKAGQIARVVLRLSKRPGPAAEDSGDPVAEILKQLEAAANELDVQKMEALFLPADDPRAGQAWREPLEEAQKDWPRIKSAGDTMQVHFVGTKQRSEGKDRIVTTTIVVRIVAPDGRADEQRASVELRITPTKEGWRIAEMRTDEAEHPQPGPPRDTVAKAADDPVAEILKQLEAAANELDVQKMEALFLPPDDTPAGQSRGKHLYNAREFSRLKAAGATLEVRFVRIRQKQDGKDWIVSTTMVSQFHDPGRDVQKGGGTVQFRITPTPDGWKIAEAKPLDEPAEEKVVLVSPTPRAQRQRHFVRLVVGKDSMTFEGQETSWEKLPALLENVPNRPSTVLEIAAASEDLTLKEKNEATGRADTVARQFGFEYLSYIGVHPLGSKGTPTQTVPEDEAPATAPEPLSFGPVIEKVLKEPKDRVAELLDLDTGRRSTITEFGANDRETHRRVREQGVDVLGAIERMPGLLLFDMAVVETPSTRWDTITPVEIASDWGLNQQEPNPITALATPDPSKLPKTCIFETREGSKGVLQLVGLSDDGEAVKIRYKLVEHAVSDVDAADERAVRKVVLRFAEVVAMVESGYATPKVLERPVALATGTVVAQMDDWREVASAGLDPAKIRSATVGRGRALVVTEFGQLKDPKYPKPVCLVYTLVQQDGRWVIDDIDLEDAEGLAGERRRFDAEFGRPGANTQN